MKNKCTFVYVLCSKETYYAAIKPFKHILLCTVRDVDTAEFQQNIYRIKSMYIGIYISAIQNSYIYIFPKNYICIPCSRKRYNKKNPLCQT